ncbi:DLA class I histocompatibility antigen, A9/A9 alpha chain-like [Python bivittatus]|uniref:DLA class I histocompatibility antigen, A9/A9 alpha chain-like n=1 Tax=Python bivittatus TaxID=176946 RepID=A0A9F3QUY8_PYTBI|nr:DLA class I histocompatibility antigen, A9/A9 alpha chain-like [Python bivittatus]
MGLPVARLVLLSAAAALLLRGGSAGFSSHSLHIFYTLVLSSSQDKSQYIVVGYVDDQIAARFDPSTRRMLPQVAWLDKLQKEDPHFWDLTSQRVRTTERRFKSDLAILHSYYNSSRESNLPSKQKQPPNLVLSTWGLLKPPARCSSCQKIFKSHMTLGLG